VSLPRQTGTDRDDVRELQESIQEWSRTVATRDYPRVAIEATSNGVARFGVMTICSGDLALELTLPPARVDDIGRTLSVLLGSGSSTITFALGGATVNGASSYSISTSNTLVDFVVVGDNKWLAR
jgi:hypothetical protein